MFKDILLAIDLNDVDESSRAIEFVRDYAGHAGATIHVVTVVPDFTMSIVGSYFPKNFEKQALEDATSKLKALTDERFGEGLKVQHIITHGTVYQEIVAAAEKTGADLIVVCSGARDLKDYLLGTNAARVVRHATASVMVIR